MILGLLFIVKIVGVEALIPSTVEIIGAVSLRSIVNVTGVDGLLVLRAASVAVAVTV